MSSAIHSALTATETNLVVPRAALLSVSDKTGIIELWRALVQQNVQLISTGWTALRLRENDVPVQEVDEITSFPEMLDGRVKTLQPQVFGGILAARGSEAHMNQLTEHNIKPIDIIVVNLYPFADAIAKPGCTFAQAIENIDIGGPSLVRAAAKNWDGVAIVTDPDDYRALIECILQNGGVTRKLRLKLMKKAYAHTAQYDTTISAYLESQGA
jgi:phosphoribosylaminoimidazolecarboxamide formyltransferase / IMP cyclohydrolase